MVEDKPCSCGAAPKLIFSCSGGADVGALADQAARKMTSEGVGRMFCLAGIGGRVSGIVKTTEGAQAILAIDGCPLNCTKKCLEEAGFKNFEHLNLMDLGFQKGDSPASDANIAAVVQAGTSKLAEKGCI